MTAFAAGPMVLASMAAAFGLLIGSFLNVVVYRVPAHVSVVAPPSACPRCDSRIRSYDNIPVVSWLLLRGRCRDCQTRISPRYPAVEAATGAFFAVVAVVFASRIRPESLAAGVVVLASFLFLAAISIALALIDLDTHRLPNALTYPSAIVLTVMLAGASIVEGDWAPFGRALLGAAVLGLGYLVLAVAVPNGMGLGDVKLAVVLGLPLAYLGWGPLAVGAFGAFLVGGSVAVVLLLVGRTTLRGGIPFGPSMLTGAWIGIFFGEPIWNAYLATLGLA